MKTYVSRSDARKLTGLSNTKLKRYEVRKPEILVSVNEQKDGGEGGAPLQIVFELSEMQEVRERRARKANVDQAAPLAGVSPPQTDAAERRASRGAKRLELARASLDETQQVHAEMLDDLTARARRIRGRIELLEAELVEVEKDRRRIMKMAGHTADAEAALSDDT